MPTNPTPVTVLPDPPQSTNPVPFNGMMDSYLAAWPLYRTQMNTLATVTYDNALESAVSAAAANTAKLAAQAAQSAAETALASATAQATAAAASAASAMSAPGTSATSTTSLTVAEGVQNLVIQTGKSIPIGAHVVLARTSAPATFMTGPVTSYDPATGALSLLIPSGGTDGAGTYTDWTISIGGARGKFNPGATPLGGLVGIPDATTNPYVAPDGSVYLRTGTVADQASYPNGAKCTTSIYKPVVLTKTSFGNGMFIAVDAGDVWTSTDGLEWTYLGAYAPTTVGFGVYGGGLWVFAAGSSYYTTTDFITWTPRAWTSTFTCSGTERNRVVYAGAFASYKWVAVPTGSTAYFLTSIDGITWVQRAVTAGTYAVAYDGSARIVAVAASSNAGYYSLDGVTMTATGARTNGSGNFIDIAYGGGKFVVVNNDNTSGADYTSNGGVSWTGNVPFAVAAGNKIEILYTGTRFIVGPFTSEVKAYAFSTNGTGWTKIDNGSTPGRGTLTNQYATPVATNGAGIVVSAYSTQKMISTDDLTSWWSLNYNYAPGARAPSAGKAALAVSIDNTGGGTYSVYHERKGHQLASQMYNLAVAISQDQCGVAYNGSMFVMYNTAGTAGKSSPDGKVWTARTFSEALGTGLDKLAAITGVFVGVNSTTTGTRSVDGITWADVTFPVAFQKIHSIAGLFIGTPNAASTSYYTSVDGTNWVARTTPPAISLTTSVMLNGTGTDAGSDGVYFYTGALTDNNGFCIYSTSDGINWTRRSLPYAISATVNDYRVRGSFGCGGIWLKSNLSTYYSADGGATWRSSALAAAIGVGELTVCGFYNVNGTIFMNSLAQFVGYDVALNFGSKAAVYSRIQ